MLKHQLGVRGGLELLCLGAHCDDIEIGCGGTILRLAAEHPDLSVRWIVFASSPVRAAEAQASARDFLAQVQNSTIVTRTFRDGFFPYSGYEIKEYFEELKSHYQPDIIFTHYREDRHQDHRLISDLTWNTFRNHFILEYEIPKYDGDLGMPNFFVYLDEDVCRQKIRYLRSNFPSQSDKLWFTEDTFLALMRIRGVESNAPGTYAEAFYCRKLVM